MIPEPEKPKKLKAFNISAHSFSLHWSLPSGHVDRFHVDLVPDGGFVTIRDLGGGEYQVLFSLSYLAKPTYILYLVQIGEFFMKLIHHENFLL